MSTPHNEAANGAIAKSVILPVDPTSARYIAEHYLEDAVLFNDVRGMLGYTGNYKGRRLSVMGTGVGTPSIAIYVSELMMFYGVKNLVRVANCRSLRDDVKLSEIVFALGCCTDNGYLRHTFQGDYAAVADFDLLCAAVDNAQKLGVKHHVGLIKTTDMYYAETTPRTPNWEKYGVLATDLGGVALYTHAAKHKCRAVAINLVSDNETATAGLEDKNRASAVDKLLTIALETAYQFTDE